MKLSIDGRMRKAARVVFVSGFAAATFPLFAQDAPAPAPVADEGAPAASAVVETSIPVAALPVAASTKSSSEKSVKLERVEVTGSRIRRVDKEGASPVFVLDRKSIEQSGAATLGELLQEMPSISGAAANPQVNNGGGDGASTVSLRGLSSDRTLLLLNGRRFLDGDVNSIPINMIERVEVLKDGASAVYGSDAIAGVVNFITRKNFNGLEITGQYGISDREDADRVQSGIAFGSVSEKSSLNAGLTYNTRGQVSAGDRAFSKDALDIQNGVPTASGSSFIPNGNFRVARQRAIDAGIDCSGVPTNGNLTTFRITRIEGASGDTFDAANYRCYVPLGANNDTYNFQPANVNLTPQERFGAFFSGDYKVTDLVTAYAEAIANTTRSNYQIAPEAFGTDISGLTYSADSIYNPTGQDVTVFRKRLVELGPRIQSFDTLRYQLTNGLRGSFLDDRFDWDVYFSFGRIKQTTEGQGGLFTDALQAAIGPSFRAADGTPTCGTADSPISNCTPINLFGAPDSAALALIAPKVHDRLDQTQRIFGGSIGGAILTLPAGDLGLALGAEQQNYSLDAQPDFLASTGRYTLGSSGATKGSYSVNELYAEVDLPVLKDMPFAESLKFSIGTRYSDYSTFGKTTNSKIGVEYRPYSDLLLRGTIAEVFRSPTISDLFSGSSDNFLEYDDPCNGITTPVGQNANVDRACQNVVRDGTYQQPDSQLQGTSGGNPQVTPESGKSYTYGFVFSPSFYTPVSFTADYWRFTLNETIGAVSPTNLIAACLEAGAFCDKFQRNVDGDFAGNGSSLDARTGNFGTLVTSGVDVGVRLNLPKYAIGKFYVNLEGTYLSKFNNTQVQGLAATEIEQAGKFVEASAGGDGNFARIRAQSQITHRLGGFTTSYVTRYISSVVEEPVDLVTQEVVTRKLEAVFYHDLSLTYDLKQLNTQLSLGVDNITDELPPIAYTGFAKNYDARTYDAVGRFFYTGIKVMLK